MMLRERCKVVGQLPEGERDVNAGFRGRELSLLGSAGGRGEDVRLVIMLVPRRNIQL